MRLTFVSLLCSCVYLAKCSQAATSNPQPVSVGFGPDYLGYDGAWSPVQIRVGTPEQYLLVFPSTTSSEIWVPGSSLCSGSDTTCQTLRGGFFYKSNSTSWQEVGSYELGYSALTSTVANGDYGFDDIAISDSIIAEEQIIAIVNDVNNWNGHLGLNVQETRFNNNSNHESFISTLVQNNSVIPSHSYGYTAGAAYQGVGVQGSLTLGGVDTTRYTANNFWFSLAPGYMPIAILRSVEISASTKPSAWSANPVALMQGSDAAAYVIDSSTPYLWMPENVCENIATALNLTWDSNLNLYRYSNSTPPSDLQSLDLQFTFRLANSTTASEILALQLTFGAFNLQLSYPFPGLFSSYSASQVPYFPLRRANSAQQYTIGRAFLQETYLVVDYERNIFSLSQALFPTSGTGPKLAAIARPADSTFPGPATNLETGGLSTGTIAGIAVGTVVGVAIISLAIWWFCFRRKRRHSASIADEKSQRQGLLSIFSRRSTRPSSTATGSSSRAELQADKRHPNEMLVDSSNSRFELSAMTPVEMSGGEVPPNFFQERNNTYITQRNDPRVPVELTQPAARAQDLAKAAEANAHQIPRPESPAPEYSPTDPSQSNSHTISPYTPRFGGLPFPAPNSDQAISPVTATHSNGQSNSDGFSQTRHLRNASGAERRPGPTLSPQRSSASQSAPRRVSGVEDRHLSTSDTGPRRTSSRDSRFQEDLPDARQQRSSQQVRGTLQEESNADAQSRFSWEG